jgi:hypothetical protein
MPAKVNRMNDAQLILRALKKYDLMTAFFWRDRKPTSGWPDWVQF